MYEPQDARELRKGRIPVYHFARAELLLALDEQYRKGKEKYGTVLESHNGKDAFSMALEEAVDMLQYLTQLQLEFWSCRKALMRILELAQSCQEAFRDDATGAAYLLRGIYEIAERELVSVECTD